MIVIDPVATHAGSQPAATALVDLDSGRCWTWAEFDTDINCVAHWLIERFGPASGERVAVVAKNCAAMLALQFACVRAGAIFVPINWRLADPEIAVLLADADPRLLFADHQRASALDISALATIVAGRPGISPGRCCRQSWHAPSTLLFTSGTTGKPKGVMVSEENAFWGATNFMHGNGVGSDSVVLCDMPLFHTAGLFANSRTPILAGATLLISKGFDPDLTLARLSNRKLGVTHYFSVPQMAQQLWHAPDFRPEMLRGLKIYATGGAPNPPAQVARFIEGGISMSDGFGMSETGSNFGMPVGDPVILLAKAGSIGVPYIAVEARIVDDSGSDVGDDDVGELWLRGPSVTQGYWRQPAATAAAFTNGWFCTGDVARRDADGYYFLVDRKKDMFISGGENVYPAEVEGVLMSHPALAEAAVIGVSDERWGETGYAFVVPLASTSCLPEEVIAHCRERLAAFKVPKVIVMVDQLPRTASGKVQKHLLAPTEFSMHNTTELA